MTSNTAVVSRPAADAPRQATASFTHPQAILYAGGVLRFKSWKLSSCLMVAAVPAHFHGENWCREGRPCRRVQRHPHTRTYSYDHSLC